MEAPTEEVVQTASCVAVGRFNPAILIPSWIVKEGILPDGEAEMGQVIGAGVFQFRLSGLAWQATLSKLEVSADAAERDPGAFVAQVLAKLPHTPLRAVGNNFASTLTAEQGNRLYPLVRCSLQDMAATLGHEDLGQSVTLTLAHEKEAIVRLTLEAEQSEVTTISFNFHRECGSAIAGAEAANRWAADREEARRILARMLET